LPFGVWFSRHFLGPERARGQAMWVSIAFRRLVQSSRQAVLEKLRAPRWSPLPFGVWFSRHQLVHWEKVLDVLAAVSIAFRRLVQSSRGASVGRLRLIALRLHCLSAFGSVVTHILSTGTGRRSLRSPLPFGVWFSRHLVPST